jgi:hypothetical protein
VDLVMPDLELQAFRRTINLVEYARGAAGYQPCERDSTRAIAVLEHGLAADRIAVARAQDGAWVYARLDGYARRVAEESAERAYARLRECVQGARDRGTIVEFVQSTQRLLGRDEVSLERVREHLRGWQQAWRALEPAPPEPRVAVEDARHELHRRIGDWFPSPSSGPPGWSEVQDRLRRWQEAQRVIDLNLARSSEERSVSGPAQSLAVGIPGPATTAKVRESDQPDVERSLRLQHARTDWHQYLSAEHARALGLAPRSFGPGRGR